MSTELGDLIEREKMSNCCSAAMYEMGDNYICCSCKEWCEAVGEEGYRQVEHDVWLK